MPLTMRAFIMTQHEKDNILTWNPDNVIEVGGMQRCMGMDPQGARLTCACMRRRHP